MAITQNAGPPGGRDVLHAALSKRLMLSLQHVSPVGGSPQSAGPLPVYRMTLTQAEASTPFDSLAMSAWSYPVVGGGEAKLAFIHPGPGGEQWEFGGIAHGVVAKVLLVAAESAQRQLDGLPEIYEPRILDIPALNQFVLWMHGQSSDYFFPLLDGAHSGSAPPPMINASDMNSRVQSALANRRSGRSGHANLGPTN